MCSRRPSPRASRSSWPRRRAVEPGHRAAQPSAAPTTAAPTTAARGVYRDRHPGLKARWASCGLGNDAIHVDRAIAWEACAGFCDVTVGCWGFNFNDGSRNPDARGCYLVAECAELVGTTPDITLYSKAEATSSAHSATR